VPTTSTIIFMQIQVEPCIPQAASHGMHGTMDVITWLPDVCTFTRLISYLLAPTAIASMPLRRTYASSNLDSLDDSQPKHATLFLYLDQPSPSLVSSNPLLTGVPHFAGGTGSLNRTGLLICPPHATMMTMQPVSGSSVSTPALYLSIMRYNCSQLSKLSQTTIKPILFQTPMTSSIPS
jgi:hypothetical protein